MNSFNIVRMSTEIPAFAGMTAFSGSTIVIPAKAGISVDAGKKVEENYLYLLI